MSDRVCAMVMTWNRRELLRRCLRSLQAQTRPPDEILIVNNGSTDGTREMLRREFPRYPVLDAPRNHGASWGYHQGIKWGYREGFDWVWVIDDEGYAVPDCLERLLAHRRPNAVLVPVKRDSGGHAYGIAAWRRRNVDVTAEVLARGGPVGGDFLFDFTAPLIHREVVARAGLPNKAFVIWFDDYEYALRARRAAGTEVVNIPDAVFFHDFGRNTRAVRFLGKRSMRSDLPAWKLYYGARNPLYTLLRARRRPDELAIFLLVQSRLLLMDVLYERDRRERVRMRLLGLRDGVLGRLGQRVSATAAPAPAARDRVPSAG